MSSPWWLAIPGATPPTEPPEWAKIAPWPMSGSAIRITYFNIQGPAEAARLALAIGGIPFEDVRINREGLNSLKESGKLPSGQVPLLELSDGRSLSQSQAIATFCGKLAGLCPKDPWEAAKCDEVTQLINQDIRDRVISPTMREPDAAKKMVMRKELADTKLFEKFKILSSMISPSGYFVGDSVTMADLHCYVLLNWLGMEVLDGVPKETVLIWPKLTNLCRKINSIPAVAKWNAVTNSGKVPWF